MPLRIGPEADASSAVIAATAAAPAIITTAIEGFVQGIAGILFVAGAALRELADVAPSASI